MVFGLWYPVHYPWHPAKHPQYPYIAEKSALHAHPESMETQGHQFRKSLSYSHDVTPKKPGPNKDRFKNFLHGKSQLRNSMAPEHSGALKIYKS